MGLDALPVGMKVVDADGAGSGIITMLKNAGMEPYTTCHANRPIHPPSSMVPGVSGIAELTMLNVAASESDHQEIEDTLRTTPKTERAHSI